MKSKLLSFVIFTLLLLSVATSVTSCKLTKDSPSEEWELFYKEYFSMDVDFSQVAIPSIPTHGNWKLLFIPKGMKFKLAYDAASKIFRMWDLKKENFGPAQDEYNELFVTTLKNIRTTDKNYAIWVRDDVEPDFETLGQSTLEADPNGKKGITLIERTIFEIKYFAETGKHLDVKGGSTLCSGSRFSSGQAVFASWNENGKFVGLFHPSHSDSLSGIRSVVGL